MMLPKIPPSTSLVKSARDRFKAAMRSRVSLIAAAFSLSALPALACSCSGGNPGSCQVPVADIIVRATVVSKEEPQTRPPFARPTSSGAPQPAFRPAGAMPQPEHWGRVKVTLTVSERFRGAAGDSLVVRTEVGLEACGYPFEVGHEYLVFANEYQEQRDGHDMLRHTACENGDRTDPATTCSSRRDHSAGPIWVRGHIPASLGPNRVGAGAAHSASDCYGAVRQRRVPRPDR
jgi:hypothetical protein